MNEREEWDAERRGSEDGNDSADRGDTPRTGPGVGTGARDVEGDERAGVDSAADDSAADGGAGGADGGAADGGAGDADIEGADSRTQDAGTAGTAGSAGAGAPGGRPRPTPHRRSPVTSAAAGTAAATTTTTTAAQPRGGGLRRTGRVAGRTFVTLLSVIALGVTGYAYARLDQLHDAIETTDALDDWHYESSGDEQAPPPPPKDDGATDILLVGADSRTDMQGNPLPLSVLKALRTESTNGIKTDTMIILRIPKDGGDPVGVSVPRDTWVDVPHGGKDKVNSAYGAAKSDEWQRLQAEGVADRAQLERDSNQAGRRALVRTLQDFTQIHIDHYAEINLLGFYLLTESIGGVEVCLNAPTKDKDSGADFEAGVQTVTGGEALSFVRQRKNLPNGDLDRIVRQHTFLSSALNKAMSTGTLTDPDKLSDLIDTVRRSLVLDPDLDVLGFAQQAKDLLGGGLEFETIPVTDVAARSDGGQSIVTVDVQQVRSFVRGLVNGNGEARGDAGGSGGPSNGGGESPAAPNAADDEPAPNGGGAAAGGTAHGVARAGALERHVLSRGEALGQASAEVPCVN
ncbi:LCP family protein required for cell wall assembly [Prauserella isguenensis]|uniref:LCP family protein required for cell wall assembly n=1 Tax=Prauserella isguenensis TaxID=1470180 RepID=A0A839S837_9PSEU|nr:LCP family protein required for cell wall assembly [Prauserella isguenensis]